MKIYLFLYLLVTSTSMFAQGVDVYGVNLKDAQSILQRYEKRVSTLIDQVHAEMQKNPDFLDSSKGQALRQQRAALIEEIKQQNGFLHVNLETIYYQQNDYFTTIDIVTSNQKDRLKYLSPKRDESYPKTEDVLDSMQEYLALSRSLFYKHQIHAQHDQCPVYHCTLGFDHPQLKPYLNLFNKAATQDKQFILNTLNHDPNPTRRAAAAYVVGHFKDPHEIIRVLLPHVQDPDDGVRNNVIRVLSLTSLKSKIVDIDPAPFVALLNSPSLIDRNKSLFLLSQLMTKKSTQHYLIQHAQTPLLRLYMMKQPNQQEFAYLILKALSGKDFGEHNFSAWKNWFVHARKKIA